MAESFTLSHARLISLSEAGTIPRGYIRISDGYIEDIGSMDAYVAKGGSKSCQDCHMDKGHMFPGGRNLDTVKQGLGFDLQINPYRHLPGPTLPELL